MNESIIESYYKSRQKQFSNNMEFYFNNNSHHCLKKYIDYWVSLVENGPIPYDLDWEEADRRFVLWLKENI